MSEWKPGAVESRFADIIWSHAPIASGELARRCEAELGWKRTTTYTVLKKLCGRGLFTNNGGTVEVLVPREASYARQSQAFVEETFHGSLPAFLAAFTARKRLTAAEIDELRAMIDGLGKEE